MPRFYLPPDQCRDPLLFLRGREAHHALRVLRLDRGDGVTVLDGAGNEFKCRVEKHDRDKLALAVVEKRSVPPLPYQITLVQAIPKAKLFEAIVQKATELGAYRVVPLISERVVATPEKTGAAQKTEKWRVTAIEAVKQCGSAWLPLIDPPTRIKEFVGRKDRFDLALVASLQPGSRHPRQYFETFYAQNSRPPGSVCLWIGPEGDFTAAELDLIQSSGALPVSLGRLVLRTETAATYCLSIVNYELQAALSRR